MATKNVLILKYIRQVARWPPARAEQHALPIGKWWKLALCLFFYDD